MSLDITLPEVTPLLQSARFFRNGERDFVEISCVGSKDTVVERVTPTHMARFRAEWDGYCDGQPPTRRGGIALTELASIDAQRAEHYVSRNIHNLEELAALSDAQCQGVGHGALTDRKAAQRLVMQRQFETREKAQRAVADASASLGPKPAEAYASGTELAELKGEVLELKQLLTQVAEALNSPAWPEKKRGPGRPRKEPQQEAVD
jgi:hypothetical protein